MNCAEPLALVCAECGTESPSSAKFCFNCSAPVGEPAATEVVKADTISDRLQRLIPKEYAERLL